MELEVGVRINRDTGDLTFASTETEAVFVLAAHLPGFTKDEIEVAMNAGDSQIIIRGGGHIAFQEAVITSRVAISREVSIECFDESFPVPDSVDLDGIDTWFDEEEKILIISIPKLLTNECPWIGEEETVEHPIQEERKVLEAELFETKKEERELPKEQDEEKLNGGPAYEKPTSAEWPETRKLEIELQGTKENEKHIDIEKRPSLETKEGSQDDHQKEEKIKQCLEKSTEKPSQLVKEEAKQQKSKEKAEKEMHQPEEEWLQEKKNHKEELPHDKPKTEKLPEPRELHQQDGKPQLEITDQVMETKHPTKSQETEEEIQKPEQEHEKPATVQKDKKSKDVGLQDIELISLNGFKDDEAGQLKGPDIEAFRAREQLKPKELSLDLHKQKTEKPTLEVPKETREAVEPTKTEKEEKVETEQRQPEEQQAQEQKMPIVSREKTTMKFQGPKELGQKLKQDRVSAPEQVLEAAQDIQSETEEELKQHEHEEQEDTGPIVVPTFEKPKTAELPQTKEPKPWVYELYEDEDHQWVGPDRKPSKSRMPIELEEKYKNLQQEEEIVKQKAEKPTEKAQKQLFQVAESTKSDGEKEAKKEAEQIEEQKAHEYKKPIIQPPHEEVSAKKLSEPNKTVQAHEKVGVKELDKILEAARQIQSVDMEELQKHEDEVQEQEKFIVLPTYEKPKASGLIKKEELKPVLRVLNEDEEDSWKIAGISTQKIRESQYLHQEQVKNKQNTEKPSVKAPRQILTVEEPTKQEEKEAKQQMEKPEEQEASEHRKSTLHPPYEKHESKQSAETKKEDKKHKPKVRELVQVLEAVEAQPEEQEGLIQHEQEIQEHEKAIVVPACEKPQITTPNQVLEDEEYFQSKQLEKVYQQDNQELQKQEIPRIMPKSKKPKASECAKKEAPKPQIYELQECKHNQWMGPDTEISPNKKSFKPGEESQLPQQEQEIMKQKAEKPICKQLVEAIEPTQPEEEKEAENGLDQSKEKEVEKGKKFQISVEGHDHEIIAVSQVPVKQEEPILKESTTLEKYSKQMLELALGSPYETPDIINFGPLEELELPTPKAPNTKGALKRQESSRQKESEEFEKSIARPAFKAPKIKEFTSLEEQKHDLPELKQWIHGFKEDEDRQLKDTNREAFETRESMKPKELSLNLQKLKTEKPTLKAPKDMSKAADLIKTGKEERVETKLHQHEELEKESEQHEQELKKQEKTAVVQTCEKPKAAEYAGKEESKQQIGELQEDKKQLLQQEQIIQKQKAEKPTKKVQKRFQEATEPAQSEDEEKEAKQEPDQPKEQEAQGRQIRRMPTYEVEQEQKFQISVEEGRDHEIIAESIEPEKQEEPIPKEPTTLEKEYKPMLEHIESKEHLKPAVEAPYQTPDMIDFKTPGITKKKEEQQREQLDRKQKKWDKTTLFESETEKYKIPTADSPEIKGIPESLEPYEKPGESLHVEAEKQLKPPGETKAQEITCSAVGAQLPGKPTVGPSEQESQTKQLEQATEFSIPRIQQTESKQTKKHEEPLRQFMEDESKDQPEQQFKQPDVEEWQKRASPPEQELERNGATLEPPDRAARTNAVVETVMEQNLYRAEEGELQQDIKSPKLQKPPPIPSELEGGQVPEHDETTLEPTKPLPRVRETMETASPPPPTMEKEATEPTITPPKIRGATELEGSPLLPSSDAETMEREFPTLIQKEFHPGSDLQNAEEQKTASCQIPEFDESAEEQDGKTKEPPPPHRAHEEIQRPTEDVLHKIFEVPQPMKIYAPKELEEEQELNPPLPLDHDKKTLEEVSSDEVEASCVEMDKSTKVTKLSRRRRFHCRCRGRRPAYPIPPSTLLSGSAFVFSIMVLVFHFIKRKKPN